MSIFSSIYIHAVFKKAIYIHAVSKKVIAFIVCTVSILLSALYELCHLLLQLALCELCQLMIVLYELCQLMLLPALCELFVCVQNQFFITQVDDFTNVSNCIGTALYKRILRAHR